MLDTKFGMKYSFPHTLVHIVDNSSYTGDLPVVVAQDPSMYGTIVVAGFPMGEDGKVIQVTRSDILSVAYGLGKIGASDIKKYGQTITYPLSIIDQGAPVQLLRITPPDATYAYSCITVEWRWDRENKLLHVRYGTYSLENDLDLVNFQNKQRLADYIKKHCKKNNFLDDTGEKWDARRAFLVNVSAGRGSAYNRYTTTIEQTVQAKRPANVRYLFSTIDSMTNLVAEKFHASLVNISNNRDDSIDPVNIVIGKRVEGSSVVVPFLNEEAVQELYNVYREHYAEMKNDNSNKFTEYENEVYATLNVNTFDPIFGLYLYDGTDSNARLPFLQIDMRTSDRPELAESQRVYYTDSEDPDHPVNIEGEVSKYLVDLTTGIKVAPTDDSGVFDPNAVFLGDVYLYGGITSNTNPYIYIVAGINQYTSGVTTVRTNMLRFKSADRSISGVDSKLAYLCEAKEQITFVSEVCKKLRKGYVKDNDTVAWYNTETGTWNLYYVKDGSVDLAKTDAYVAEVNADLETSLLAYFNPDDPENANVNGYDFIAWKLMENVGNVIGLVGGEYGTGYGDAYNRAGATCINVDASFSTPTDPTTPVWVNAGFTEWDSAEGTNIAVKYTVEDRSLAKVLKYGQPPTTTTLVATNVVGSQYDACCVSETDAVAYNINDTVEETVTGADGKKVENRVLGWIPESHRFLFNASKATSDTKITLEEFTNEEISKNYYNNSIGVNGMTVFVALDLYDAYYSEYELTMSEPADWGTTYTTYFTKSNGEYVAVPESDPAPDWAANTYYRQLAAPEFFARYNLAETSKYDKTTNISKWSAFKDITDPSDPKFYKSTGSAYELLTDISSNDQILRWYYQNSNGEWNIDRNVPDDTTDLVLGGFTFKLVQGDFTYVQDARSATKITRFTVIGTIGSLYRTQQNAIDIPANYYSTSYGINVTASSDDVKLHDGSTGFFDDYGTSEMSDIEYKWNYSKLLVEAFRGRIDPRIMSPNRVPAKYLFDGGWNTVVGQSALPSMAYSAADLINASTIFTAEEKDEVLYEPDLTAGWNAQSAEIDVKQAMYDLMDYRIYTGMPEDMRPVGPGSGMSLHLDSGVTDATMALTINNSFQKRFNNPNASWDIGGYYSSVDGLPYTYMKRIVDNLFRHCQTFSVNKPFVNTYSKIDRTEYTSYFPDIDTTDWDYRQLMYNSGGNAWIPDKNGAIMRRSQRTLYRSSDTSDLIQESNMRTLTQLVYILQDKLEEKLFEYNDDSFLRTMQDEVNNLFTNWVGNLVDSLDIHFERDINPLDGGELIVCYVDVVFRGINLRIPVIVNVNRRATLV